MLYEQFIKTWILRLLICLAFCALGNYFVWWFEANSFQSTILTALLILTIVYHFAQLLASWILYLAAKKRSEPPLSGNDLSVDVFVTCCHEDHGLIRETMQAAVEMEGRHKTWLLDDGNEVALKNMAENMGAGYLVRQGSENFKAGNINAALEKTQGDIVVMFDIDHAPHPSFLRKSLGHFNDPCVGFVQVMLTYRNRDESWIARAGMEASTEFFNPAVLGMDTCGGAPLIGTNALIRREALASIGGYRPGLAEDLATSIALHAQSWKSAYVHEPLAPGLTPPDLPGWFTQQLKWARGVLEVLHTDYPRLFLKLTWGQRLSYAVRMTYYWLGLLVFMHLLVSLTAPYLSDQEIHSDFQHYLLNYFPLIGTTILVRLTAIHLWRHPSIRLGFQWRSYLLLYCSWPIYLLAWGMTVLRVPLRFCPTPKNPLGRVKMSWLLPQLVTSGLLLVTFIYCLLSQRYFTIPVLFLILQLALHSVMIREVPFGQLKEQAIHLLRRLSQSWRWAHSK
jgi:cellulose synthase/poly-beta-1,6-N-acetylglucosamine synthase-like glycosyltransferase